MHIRIRIRIQIPNTATYLLTSYWFRWYISCKNRPTCSPPRYLFSGVENLFVSLPLIHL
jgi:hypothetical protein